MSIHFFLFIWSSNKGFSMDDAFPAHPFPLLVPYIHKTPTSPQSHYHSGWGIWCWDSEPKMSSSFLCPSSTHVPARVVPFVFRPCSYDDRQRNAVTFFTSSSIISYSFYFFLKKNNFPLVLRETPIWKKKLFLFLYIVSFIFFSLSSIFPHVAVKFTILSLSLSKLQYRNCFSLFDLENTRWKDLTEKRRRKYAAASLRAAFKCHHSARRAGYNLQGSTKHKLEDFYILYSYTHITMEDEKSLFLCIFVELSVL